MHHHRHTTPLTHIHDVNDHDDHVSATTQQEGQKSNDKEGRATTRVGMGVMAVHP